MVRSNSGLPGGRHVPAAFFVRTARTVLAAGAAILAAGLTPASAADEHAVGKVHLGFFGITSVPIAQADAALGGFYGVRAEVDVHPRFSLESNVAFTKHADGEITLEGRPVKLESPKLTTFTLQADVWLLRRQPLAAYGVLGFGWTRVDRGPSGDSTDPTVTVGTGAEISLGAFPARLDVGPRLLVVMNDGGSRKSVGLVVGLTYTVN